MSIKPVRLARVDFKPTLRKFELDLARLKKDLTEKKGLDVAIRTAGIADVHKRFETKTDASGKAWPRWSKTYFPKHNIDGILVQEGDLLNAATAADAFIGRGDKMFYRIPEVSYGLAHELGKRKKGKSKVKRPLPQRSFTPFSAAGAASITGSFTRIIEHSVVAFTYKSGRGRVQEMIRTPAGPRFGKVIL